MFQLAGSGPGWVGSAWFERLASMTLAWMEPLLMPLALLVLLARLRGLLRGRFLRLWQCQSRLV